LTSREVYKFFSFHDVVGMIYVILPYDCWKCNHPPYILPCVYHCYMQTMVPIVKVNTEL